MRRFLVVAALGFLAGIALSFGVLKGPQPIPVPPVVDLHEQEMGVLSWTVLEDGLGYEIRYGCPAIEWGEARPTARYVTGPSLVGGEIAYDVRESQSAPTCEYRVRGFRGDHVDGSATYGPLSAPVIVRLPGWVIARAQR